MNSVNFRILLLCCSTVLVLGLALISSVDHRGYLELCVCVVNSLARSTVAGGITILIGTAAIIPAVLGIRVGQLFERTLLILQSLGFIASIFFLIQYVLFVLEVVV